MSLGACEGSGCGEPPKAQSAKSGAGGGGGGSPASGGGEVALGQNVQKVLNAPLRQENSLVSWSSGTATKPATPAGPVFADVNKAAYGPTVIKAVGGSLVASYTPGCPGWKDLRAALKGLSVDLAGKVAVYRLDVSDPDQATVLPSGMTRLPVPALAYYESGQALGQRQGLPFERRLGRGGEPLEDSQQYQDRLRRWLREAVAERDFNLPEPRPQ
jgi:hypothetical protein